MAIRSSIDRSLRRVVTVVEGVVTGGFRADTVMGFVSREDAEAWPTSG